MAESPEGKGNGLPPLSYYGENQSIHNREIRYLFEHKASLLFVLWNQGGTTTALVPIIGMVAVFLYTNSYLSVEKDMNHSSFFLIREQGHWLEALEKSEWFTTFEPLWGKSKYL